MSGDLNIKKKKTKQRILLNVKFTLLYVRWRHL